MIIYACSGNQGKLREFALATDECGTGNISIQPLPGLKEIAGPEETGKSFEENAALKAVYYSTFTPELVFADDSGIEVDALGGAPGVYSARFAGLNATDEDNNRLLLQRLGSEENRRGRFVCVIGVAHRGRLLHSLRGTVEGQILQELCGEGGFGYDPLFFYPPLHKTLAELTPDEKFAVSHRGKALRAMIEWLGKRESASS